MGQRGPGPNGGGSGGQGPGGGRPAGFSAYQALDDVSVTANDVPEPATLAVLGSETRLERVPIAALEFGCRVLARILEPRPALH